MNVQVPFMFKAAIDTLSHPVVTTHADALMTGAGTILIGCLFLCSIFHSLREGCFIIWSGNIVYFSCWFITLFEWQGWCCGGLKAVNVLEHFVKLSVSWFSFILRLTYHVVCHAIDGLARTSSSLFNELRNAVFAKVSDWSTNSSSYNWASDLRHDMCQYFMPSLVLVCKMFRLQASMYRT
jgi:hypothetical protein